MVALGLGDCSGVRSSRIWDILEAEPREPGFADEGWRLQSRPVRSSTLYYAHFRCICTLFLPCFDPIFWDR